MQMLETEISYALTPLPEALLGISEKIEGAVGQFFLITSQLLGQEQGMTAGEAWKEALKSLKGSTALTEGDIDVLSSLGANLGSSHREEQLKHLRLTQEHLKHQELCAEKDREKGERIWRTAGFFGGLVIVIILL